MLEDIIDLYNRYLKELDNSNELLKNGTINIEQFYYNKLSVIETFNTELNNIFPDENDGKGLWAKCLLQGEFSHQTDTINDYLWEIDYEKRNYPGENIYDPDYPHSRIEDQNSILYLFNKNFQNTLTYGDEVLNPVRDLDNDVALKLYDKHCEEEIALKRQQWKEHIAENFGQEQKIDPALPPVSNNKP